MKIYCLLLKEDAKKKGVVILSFERFSEFGCTEKCKFSSENS